MSATPAPKVKIARDEAGRRHIMFWCPGCGGKCHQVDDKWTFNEDLVAPTIRASVLVTYNGSDAGVDRAPPARCHSFVTDGRIEYCGDSTHALAGQTVDLPDWERAPEP